MHRKWRHATRIAAALVLVLATASLMRCGRAGKNTSDKPSTSDGPSNPQEGAPAPADWDGTSDWSQSAFEVIDL